MARIWKAEDVENGSLHATLIPKWLYFVRVCGFTFKFSSIEQLKEVLEYYSQKLHPSSIIPNLENSPEKPDRALIERWYERLPLYLRKEQKRQKVVAALQQALYELRERAESIPIQPVSSANRKPRSTDFEPVEQSSWCRNCDVLLGKGRCRRCQKRRWLEPERFRPLVAYCNTCQAVLGQGSCRWCQYRSL